MKITKRQLRRIIKEAFPVKGKAVGNFIKKGRAGRKLTMQGREYIDLGKGHWQGPDGEKLNWVQLSSMASALGDEMVRIDNNSRISETKITKSQLKRIIKEEKARLLKEVKPSEMSMHDAADHYDRQRIDTNMQVPAELFNQLVELLEDIAEMHGNNPGFGKRAGDLLLKMERELGIL